MPLPILPPVSKKLKEQKYVAYRSEVSYIETYFPPSPEHAEQVRGSSMMFGDLLHLGKNKGKQELQKFLLKDMVPTILKWYDEYVAGQRD